MTGWRIFPVIRGTLLKRVVLVQVILRVVACNPVGEIFLCIVKGRHFGLNFSVLHTEQVRVSRGDSSRGRRNRIEVIGVLPGGRRVEDIIRRLGEEVVVIPLRTLLVSSLPRALNLICSIVLLRI